MIYRSLELVIIILFLIGAGFFVAWKKWVSRDAANAITKIVINLAVPGTLVYSFSTTITRSQLIDSWLPVLVALALVFANYVVAKICAKLLNIEPNRKGIFTVSFAFSNLVFIGFPVTLAAFGETGMLYAMYAYIPNTVMFWTIGYLLIRKDANTISGDKTRFRFENLKKLLTPSILTVLIMLALVLLDIKLPPTVIKISEYLGNMTTPLSLIFTG